MEINGSSSLVFLWSLAGPLYELNDNRAELIFVQLDYELLECLYYSPFDFIKLEDINFLIGFVVYLRELEHLLEERADLLEVAGAEVLFHTRHHWL